MATVCETIQETIAKCGVNDVSGGMGGICSRYWGDFAGWMLDGEWVGGR